MVQRWTVGDLNPESLFEVDYNRDVETSSRFAWPIPNMLDANGEPLLNHPNIFPKEDKDGKIKIDLATGRKDYRFRFKNHKDNTDQGVPIDGSGCILFMSPSETKSAKIKEIVSALGADKEGCSPEVIEKALQSIYLATGIGDRWNETRSTLTKKYDATHDVEDGYFGRFVYKHEISAAVYIGGNGLFDGPAESDQSFHGGTFIVFPGNSLEEARNIIKNYDPLRPKETRKGAKHVAYDVFLTTRRLPDATPIVPSDLKRQDKPKRRYYEVAPIAGFLDYEPEVQAVEGDWLKRIQDIFALYGYSRIKTRAVEELGILRLEEGINRTPSQIFEIRQAFSQTAKAEYGLRFDHTVPLARYIAENNPLGRISYPFKSARIGPVWRYQDITRGVYKEFTQADIDVVGDSHVPFEYDAEFPRVMCDVANSLGIGTIELGISNRKITKGFFEALGFDDDLTSEVIRIIEQRDILGVQGLQARLYDVLKLDKVLATKCLEFATIKVSDDTFVDRIFKLCRSNKLLEEGIEELMLVISRLSDLKRGEVMADMGVVRGMNYYTGTVYEGRCKDSPTYPPIIVGGRYDNLVGHFMSQSRPGVGASFEVTRAIDLMKDSGRLDIQRSSTKLLIVASSANDDRSAEHIAKAYRDHGNAVEMAYGLGSLDSQMAYARSKSIPQIAILDAGNIKLINLADGSETSVSSNEWIPTIK